VNANFCEKNSQNLHSTANARTFVYTFVRSVRTLDPGGGEVVEAGPASEISVAASRDGPSQYDSLSGLVENPSVVPRLVPV